jgi:hypothetical protein
MRHFASSNRASSGSSHAPRCQPGSSGSREPAARLPTRNGSVPESTHSPLVTAEVTEQRVGEYGGDHGAETAEGVAAPAETARSSGHRDGGVGRYDAGDRTGEVGGGRQSANGVAGQGAGGGGQWSVFLSATCSLWALTQTSNETDADRHTSRANFRNRPAARGTIAGVIAEAVLPHADRPA